MKVLLAAGGSGGHVIPALTVARLLKQGDSRWACVAVSTAHGVAAQIWDPAVGELTLMPADAWPQRWQAADPRYWWRQGCLAAATWRLLRQHRPDVVVGFGGAVAGPIVLLAKLAGTPTVIHEQNVLPGRTTRFLASWADRVAVSFEETRRHLPARARVTVTGNPVSPAIGWYPRKAALAALGLAPDTPVLLVMGGSQGAHAVNTVVLEAMAQLTPAQRHQIQMVHVAGPRDAAWVEARYHALGVPSVTRAFLREMGVAYAAATVAVTRAGATTLAELVATATPAVLVPYPYAQAHQAVNAQWLSQTGGAVVVPHAQWTPARFLETVWPLVTDAPRLAAMRAALQRVAAPGAAQRLADTVTAVARAA